MKILIIGASGLVGGNCMRYFSDQAGSTIVGTYYSFQAPGTVFYDTLNPDNPDNFDVLAFDPGAIVHCGALTHVDYCEDNVDESYMKTVRSTQNVTDLCKKTGAKMVYISSDYVFDGESGPYGENAAVNPLSVYGEHKLEAEGLVLKEIPGSIIIRITNVYGDEIRKKNFIARIVGNILEGKKLQLKLPKDQYATPVNAYDVARAIFLLLTHGKTGIYNIAGKEWLNRVELVELILDHFPNVQYEMQEYTTQELGQPAARPLKGGLKNDKMLGEFPKFKFSTVEEYLNKFATNNGN
jgi:dTDP-4-dehydrorhamnose reductase